MDAAGPAAAWGGGLTAGATGVAAAVGEVGGDTGAEASPLGLGAACGVRAGGDTGAGADGFGFVASGGGVLSPMYGFSHSVNISGSMVEI